MTEEKETKKPVVKVTFRLDVLRPDKRQFKQQSMELVPVNPLTVEVEVPCDNEHVVNSAKINAAVVGNDTAPEPVFTPAGLAYISNQIEQHFSDPEPEDFVLEPSEETDTGWGTENDENELDNNDNELDDDSGNMDWEGLDNPWEENDEDWKE